MMTNGNVKRGKKVKNIYKDQRNKYALGVLDNQILQPTLNIFSTSEIS